MSRGERVIAFIERYLCVPEGRHVGKPLRLMEFQKRFIREIYDNQAGTSRAYLSVGRKNGKSALIAAIVLAHIVGPEARQNSQIISGARSREQASLVFKLAQKMIGLSPELRQKSVTQVTPSQKMITGVRMNVEYKAISAEAGTAHGLSPVLAILDEVGQIKGPHDDFVEAITTSQGAHDNPLLIAISTQAATDNDLFSRWLDDAESSKDARIVSHVYTAPADCLVMDRAAWMLANPAMGEFRSVQDLEDLAVRADRLPSEENSFRWLYLNQRIEAFAPFISRAVWQSCDLPVTPLEEGAVVFGGLDLSEVSDLTALALVSPVVEGLLAPVKTNWHVHPTFWLPSEGLREKAKADRVPYDEWEKTGHLQATPGNVVDYAFVAAHLFAVSQRYDLRKIAFDRWNFRHLKPWLIQAGFTEEQCEGDAAIFEPFGQGFQSMSPALRDVETVLLSGNMRHGGHPVLTMCAANAVVARDPAGNRKLAKNKSRGRIDGMVALAMAMSVAGTWQAQEVGGSYLDGGGLVVL
jgi:phage terminase large subunit-like protein